jgi:Tol biopolymer transport system component
MQSPVGKDVRKRQIERSVTRQTRDCHFRPTDQQEQTMLHSIRFPLAVLALVLLAAAKIAPLAAQQPNEEQDNRIYVCQPDGSQPKPLLDIADYKMQGSPTWSQDGKLIAFDAWRPRLGEKNTDSKIIVVSADGSGAKVLGDGAMPSFSPRHNRIAFCRYTPNYGIWVMSSEGPEKELVLLDEQGWCAEWSPDGRQIAYTATTGEAANLMIFDLVEGLKYPLFEEGASPYVNLFWNFCWSPDGKWIVFKGGRANGKLEIALVDARGAKHGHIVRLEADTPPNFGWTHDSKSIFFTQRTADRGNRLQLYLMDAATKDPPQLLGGQDPARINAAASPSPDGKQLLIVSRKPPPAAAKAKAKKS